MTQLHQDTVQAPPRRPARDITDAILQNMRENLELLKYSTLAPSRYLVYLHPVEYQRLEGIFPLLKEEAVRALGEALDRLNHRSPLQRYKEKLFRGGPPQIQNAGAEWQVEFIADPDDELKAGDILIESELLLPSRPELGAGERTRRITTLHSGANHTTKQQTVPAPTERSSARPLATLTYEDNAGQHAFDIGKDSVTIGRGGIAYPVDVRISASADVSREHLRIRRDASTGHFFLIDLSSLGTTLNGRHVPPGYQEVDGTKRENGVETALPDRARIGLADTVYLEFEARR